MTTEQAPVSRDDIEAKFRQIKDEVDTVTNSTKNKVVPIAGAVGLVLAILFYLLGSRSGKKKSAVVEIRRL